MGRGVLAADQLLDHRPFRSGLFVAFVDKLQLFLGDLAFVDVWGEVVDVSVWLGVYLSRHSEGERV
jgi:hypothetical protein